MSVKTICDICNKPGGKWEFRQRFTIRQWFNHPLVDGFYNMDVCDSCFAKFKEFVKEKDK